MKERSKITIHTGGTENGAELHPSWRGENDEEITDCPLAPEEGEMLEINQRLQTILDRAPSDASAELSIRRTDDGYRGLLNVYSLHRHFSGGFKGARLREVIDRVVADVFEQINDWKRSRVIEAGDGL
ncbi:MAG TPA: hypothetical protein VM432_14375 [Bdellovibrionales bacterium]|jgi:hypothetical protein|nr:hypothetical protein [Bdellovibrionales bacterium]